MPGPGDFIKENIKQNAAGKVGKGFLLFDIANLTTSDNKLKSLWETFKGLVLLRPVMAAGFAGMFYGMSKAINSLVKDTGSLDAALKKLSQIQGLEKMFTGMMGGAEAAKLKVAELVNFAATRNITLGDAAEASRSLMLMTKNAFSSARALDTVNDAAEATNNSVVNVADAVGQFNMALQGGESIDQTTNALRNMGVISDATARTLITLQKNGASTGQVFDSLTASLEQFKGGAAAAAAGIEGVNKEFEKAATALQEKFGSPFVADDVQNTKNYTEAMKAVAPSVARVASFLNILTGGFSGLKSQTVEFVATTKVLRGAMEGLVYVMTSLVGVVSLLGAKSLFKFFQEMAKSMSTVSAETIMSSKAMSVFEKGLNLVGVNAKTTETVLTKTSGVMSTMTKLGPTLARAMSLVPVIAVAVAIGSAIYKWGMALDEAAKALMGLQSAQSKSNQETRAAVKGASTMAQMHEAVTMALKKELEARIALNEAQAKGNENEIAAMEAQLDLAAQIRARAVLTAKGATGPTEAQEEKARRDRQRALDEKEADFQNKMSAAKPAERVALMTAREAELKAKIKQGERGENTTAAMSSLMANADAKVQLARHEVELAQAEKDSADAYEKRTGNIGQRVIADMKLAAAQPKLQEALKEQAGLGANQKAGTSVEIMSRMRSMELSEDPDKIQKTANLKMELEAALQVEKETGQNRIAAMENAAALAKEKREMFLNKLSVDREMAIQEAAAKKVRPEGRYGSPFAPTPSAQDQGQSFAQRASLATRWNTAAEDSTQAMKDLGLFSDKLEELLDKGFKQDVAEKMATSFADNAITLESADTQAKMMGQSVGDSLTKIGGGGGQYTAGAGVDPMLSATQRTNDLHVQELQYLKQIAAAGKVGVL